MQKHEVYKEVKMLVTATKMLQDAKAGHYAVGQLTSTTLNGQRQH